MSAGLEATMLLDPDVIDDPYPFYRRLHDEAPVWRVPGTPVVTVSSFALVTEALARVEDFSSNMRSLLFRNDEGLPQQLSFGTEGQQTLATADPPFHAVHRKTVFPELVARRMLALEPGIGALAADAVARVLDSGTVDFMDAVGNLVPMTVINDLVGFVGSDPRDLLRPAFDSTAMLGAALNRDDLDVLIGRIGPTHAWIETQLDAALADLDGDTWADKLLGTIARGVAGGTFGRYEATIMLQTLLSAGGETTSSLLGNATSMLAQRPELQDRLREHPELLPAFIEEALRLESPFRHMLRSVPAATSLGGVDLAAGDTVLLLFGAANRDPQQYADPDELDLDREEARTHLAFGKGIHYCVGARLARLEAAIVLRELLARTSRIELDPEVPPRRARSILVRRFETLPVRLR